MTFWPLGTSTPLNSLCLGGDGDEVDLLADGEKRFLIRFEQADVAELVSMGDLEALVAAKRGKDAASGNDWAQLCQIARLQSGHNAQIDRNTTFFAKFAQPREIENG